MASDGEEGEEKDPVDEEVDPAAEASSGKLKCTRRAVRQHKDPVVFKIDATFRSAMTKAACMQMARPFKRKTSSFAQAMAGVSASKGPTWRQ